MSHSPLHILESESITILREVAAQFRFPVLLYSVGKDSSVLLHLCKKAFKPGKIPFPLLHVDTGYKFPEMYNFRDEQARLADATLIVRRNEEAIKEKANPFTLGTQRCCSLLKTQALLSALTEGGFDAAIGGARRDEERSRAKERIFSFRDRFGQWDPRNQRPELWNLYNGKIREGESIRVFPISNWTEVDIWHYIHQEKIPIVPLYFANRRSVVLRGEQLIPVLPDSAMREGDRISEVMCRFRTLGCMPCTGAVRSEADTILKILEETITVTRSERTTRVIDYDGEASMESRKREGYF